MSDPQSDYSILTDGLSGWVAPDPPPPPPPDPVPISSSGRPGYFTPFLPQYFTGYFPGAGFNTGPVALVAPPGPAPAGYFTGYFPGYFTPYFPGAGGVRARLVVPTPPMAGTFLAAVRRALMGDAVLAGMVRGGVWKDEAPRNVPYPFITLAETSSDPEYSTIDQDGMIPFVERKTLVLTAYSKNSQAAISIAKRIIKVVDDNPLTFAEGVLMEVRHDQGYQMMKTTEYGYGGAIIFQVVIPYEADIQKLFPFVQ